MEVNKKFCIKHTIIEACLFSSIVLLVFGPFVWMSTKELRYAFTNSPMAVTGTVVNCDSYKVHESGNSKAGSYKKTRYTYYLSYEVDDVKYSTSISGYSVPKSKGDRHTFVCLKGDPSYTLKTGDLFGGVCFIFVFLFWLFLWIVVIKNVQNEKTKFVEVKDKIYFTNEQHMLEYQKAIAEGKDPQAKPVTVIDLRRNK